MSNRIGLVLALACTWQALPTLGAVDGSEDYWKNWRARQRAELARLLKPPAPPDGEGNPIDRFLAAGQPPRPRPPVVDDRTFVRRLYLDVIGLLPTPAQLDTFLRAPHPATRARLI